MKKCFKRVLSSALTAVMLATSSIAVAPVTALAASFSTVGGWYETLYAEWSDSNPDSSAVKVGYKLSSASSYTYLSGNDLTYLVRKDGSYGRVDIPGLKAGTYDLQVTSSSGTVYEKTGVSVYAHDRSGYAHFNNTTGVGAYNDDGTPKSNAVILYVTNDNKNTVELPGYEGFQATTANTNVAKGVGNILNNNLELLKKVTITDNRPLIVRIVDSVDAPNNLTPPAEKDSILGGSTSDNGYLAIMKHGRNITIEGIGDKAVIDGWGLTFAYTAAHPAESGKNFEVRNLTFQNYPEDGVAFQGESEDAMIERCWIHNCKFYPGYCKNPTESDKSEGDGSCDFKRGLYYTNSYNYYQDCHKTNLIGSGDSDNQWYITFHHNWYKNVESRQPLQAGGNVHIYNTYFQGASSTTVDCRGYNSCFLEANYYDSCKNYYKSRKSYCVAKSYGETISGGSKGDVTGTYTVASSRTTSALKDNGLKFPNGDSMKDWDMNSTHFYYSGSKSDVQVLQSASAVPAYVQEHAGTLKSVSDPGTEPGEGGSTDDEATETTTQSSSDSDDTTETTTQSSVVVDPSGAATMGTYNFGSSASGGDFNITSKAACEYGNVQFQFRDMTTDGAKTRKDDGNTNIYLTLASSTNVTLTSTGKGMVATSTSGTEYEFATGTVTVTLPAGTYTIQGSSTSSNSAITQMILASNGTVETTTEATTKATTEATTEATTKAPSTGDLSALSANTYDAATMMSDTSKFIVSGSSATDQVKINENGYVEFKVNNGATVTVTYKCGSSDTAKTATVSLNGKTGETLAGAGGTADLVVSGLSAGTYRITASQTGGTTAQVMSVVVTYGSTVVTESTTEATTAAPVSGVKVAVGSASGTVGNTVTIPVTVSGMSTLAAVDMNVYYDASKLNVTNVAAGNAFSSDYTFDYSASNGTISVAAVNPRNTMGGSVLFNITATLTAEGTSTLSADVQELYAQDLAAATPSVSSGSVTATAAAAETIMGDANADGYVTKDDVTHILQYVTKKISAVADAVAAEVTGDGKITSKDANKIMKYVLGKISSL